MSTPLYPLHPKHLHSLDVMAKSVTQLYLPGNTPTHDDQWDLRLREVGTLGSLSPSSHSGGSPMSLLLLSLMLYVQALTASLFGPPQDKVWYLFQPLIPFPSKDLWVCLGRGWSTTTFGTSLVQKQENGKGGRGDRVHERMGRSFSLSSCHTA